MLSRAAVLGLAFALAACTDQVLLNDVWDAGPDLAGNKDVGPPAQGDANCSTLYPKVTYWPRSAKLLILFDRSTSMQSYLGSTSREAAAESALLSAIGTYQGKVMFGFEQFPPDSNDKAFADCQGNSCCAGSVIVEPAINNYKAIDDPLKCGETPGSPCPTPSYLSASSAALVQARDWYWAKKKYASPNEDWYALLVTASEPGCSPAGDSRDPCSSAKSAATDLSNLRVRVVVLSVGYALGTNSCLTRISETGSPGLLPAGMNTLYTPSSSNGLSSAVNDFVAAVAKTSCTLNLDLNNAEPPAQAQLQIYMGMTSIPQNDPNGWSFTDAGQRTITLSGRACDQFATSQLFQLTGNYSCSSCGDGVACP